MSIVFRLRASSYDLSSGIVPRCFSVSVIMAQVVPTPKYPWYEDETDALKARGLTRNPQGFIVSRLRCPFSCKC